MSDEALEVVEMAEEAALFIEDALRLLEYARDSASLCGPTQGVIDAIAAAESVVELAGRVAREDHQRKVNRFEQISND